MYWLEFSSYNLIVFYCDDAQVVVYFIFFWCLSHFFMNHNLTWFNSHNHRWVIIENIFSEITIWISLSYLSSTLLLLFGRNVKCIFFLSSSWNDISDYLHKSLCKIIKMYTQFYLKKINRQPWHETGSSTDVIKHDKFLFRFFKLQICWWLKITPLVK